jgi:hypothetical protein
VGSVNGLPGGRPAREPDSRHLPEPTEHPWLFAVGDYLFDSTLNGVLDSADVVAEWIVEEIVDFHNNPTNGAVLPFPAPGKPANGSANGHGPKLGERRGSSLPAGRATISTDRLGVQEMA